MHLDAKPEACGKHFRYHAGYLKLVTSCPIHGYHDVGDGEGRWFQRFTIQISVN